MCTLSFFSSKEGAMILTMNRDESRARKEVEKIEVGSFGELSWIYPVDGQAGGTWIAANSTGLALALLNAHPPEFRPRAPEEYRSRGLLIPDLISRAASVDEAISEAQQVLDPESMPPFLLLAFDQQSPYLLRLDSDGKELKISSLSREPQLWASSAFDEAGAIDSRRSQYQDLLSGSIVPGQEAEMLRRFHASHNPEPGPYSLCVHREQVASVSRTQFVFKAPTLQMRYNLGSPCEARRELSQEISLVPPG